ncbi:J domain-containing protein [Nostoc sp.]|uniref:J domain-containing protein n=1 Tax=Nostoc sp. TaxID=1180 RepID=UPI002FF7FD0C
MSKDKPKRLRFDINHVYDILGLKPGASVDRVKQAYGQMAKTWHPDCFFEPQRTQRTQRTQRKRRKRRKKSLTELY